MEVSYVSDVMAMCPLCVTPQMHLDVALMLYGPEKTWDAYHTTLPTIRSAAPGGVLHEHWRHLQRAMLLPQTYIAPPSEESDPVVKTRWTQKRLFQLCFSADDTPDTRDKPEVYLNTIRAKNSVLSTLLGAVRLEAELLGHLETAKQLGKRRADKEIAKDEELMGEDERLGLARAALRAKGYSITKIVEEVVDVTQDSEAPSVG